jgi:hypothetical protein
MTENEDWSWEKDLGFDTEGRQHKEACLAISTCPVRGQDVELVGETEVWVQADDGRWLHDSHGPAVAVCCNQLIADWWEGSFVYDLGEHDE